MNLLTTVVRSGRRRRKSRSPRERKREDVFVCWGGRLRRGKEWREERKANRGDSRQKETSRKKRSKRWGGRREKIVETARRCMRGGEAYEGTKKSIEKEEPEQTIFLLAVEKYILSNSGRENQRKKKHWFHTVRCLSSFSSSPDEVNSNELLHLAQAAQVFVRVSLCFVPWKLSFLFISSHALYRSVYLLLYSICVYQSIYIDIYLSFGVRRQMLAGGLGKRQGPDRKADRRGRRRNPDDSDEIEMW